MKIIVFRGNVFKTPVNAHREVTKICVAYAHQSMNNNKKENIMMIWVALGGNIIHTIV